MSSPETVPIDAARRPEDRLRLSRQRLRLAMQPHVSPVAAASDPGVLKRAAERLKAAVPGAAEVAEIAREHRAFLAAAGVGLLVLVARPWRLLLKPKFVLYMAAPLLVYGVKRVPSRVWTNFAIGVAQTLYARRKSQRQVRKRRKDAARAWADTQPPRC